MSRKRYRINWNALKPEPKKKRKGRRRIRRSLIAAAVILAALITAAFRVPAYLVNQKLMDLGYTEAEVRKIREADLTELILTNAYYSPLLAKSILNGTLNTDYLPLYLAMDEDSELTADDFLLYSRLKEAGYETDQLQNLFRSLTFREITPLLVFDYQYNEQLYIDDVIASRETNTDGTFRLNSTYRDSYKTVYTVSQPDSPQVLVNKTWQLPADYTPADLTAVSSEYAVSGIQLAKEAADAFSAFASSGYSSGVPIYAIVGYRSYDEQNTAYSNAVTWYGESAADSAAARAGASEHQTGLCVNITCVGEDGAAFEATSAYQWVTENCTDFGFILRYPQGTETITGFSSEPDHYRYVGREIAAEVKESGLTYDEFWLLYLAGWDDASCRPSKEILDAVYPVRTAQKEIQNVS